MNSTFRQLFYRHFADDVQFLLTQHSPWHPTQAMDVKEAYALMRKAEQSTEGKGFFSFFKSSSTNWEERGEMYCTAGNIFKANQKWKEAGDAYLKSASYYEKAGERTDSCNMYQNAASCLRREDPPKAIECYNSALTIMLQNGRFSSAAKLQKEIGEIYEKDLLNFAAAVEAYVEAGDRFLGEDSRATASDCIMRAAKVSCETNNVPRTFELFQKLIEVSLTSDYAQFVLKDYLFGACLCLLVMRNPNQATQEVEAIADKFPSFRSEREYESIEALRTSLLSQDIAAFQEAVQGIDFYSKLDSLNNRWKSSLLIKIRSKIQEEPSLA